MKRHSSFHMAALAIALISATAVSAIAANAKWLSTFGQSEKGAYILGNPAARTKVVEYMSYTCGHCANFENAGAPLLKSQFVATGKASLEIRNFVMNPLDITAAMLARCGGKGRFFGNHKHLLATQKVWLGNAAKISAATEAKLQSDDFAGYMRGVYTETGLATIMQQRGITVAQGKACLGDAGALKAIVNMTDAGSSMGVQRTPTFMIDGQIDDEVYDFTTLKAKISLK